MKISFSSGQFGFKDMWRGMNQSGTRGLLTLFIAAVVLAGCHGDPNVRKQKYLESGKRYSAEGKYREAVIQFSNALKVDKNYPDAHYELSQAYAHLGQFNGAYAELSRTVSLQPTNYKARIDLGNLLLAGGKTDDAEKQGFVVVAAEPNNPDVHALFSAIARRRGNMDIALEELHRALALDPNRAAFHEDLAILESSDSDKTSAVEDELKKSVALDPKSVNAKLLLAAFYAKNSRWPEAEQASRDAIATDPKSLPARVRLAEVFLKEGNQAKAEEVFRQASQDLADNPQGVRILADYYAGSGQIDKARTEFSSLAAKYPKSVSVQKGYVRVLLEQKDYWTAQKVVAELMKKNAKDPEVAGLNGIVLLNSGKPSDAVNALQNAVKESPKDGLLQYWLGKAALAKGDIDLAEKSMREAVTLNPSRLNAEEELALIAAQRGDMLTLSDVANKTIAAAPQFPGGYVWRAMVEMKHNTPDKAEADLQTAINKAPQSPQAYLLLGKLRFSQKRYPEGVSLMEQTLQRDPDSVEAMLVLINYYIQEKQPEKAVARLNAQINKSPKISGYYDLLTQLQIHDKKLDQAAATAQKAIQLNPGDGEAVVLFARVQVARGQTASAIGTWEQWANAHPNDAGAYATLGVLEESRGDTGKAEAYYKKALQIQPQQPLAANNLAYRMLENGENVDVALSLAQTARRGMPNSPSTADTLAWAYYYKGTYSFARDLLEDALKADQDSASMQYHLGMVYAKLRDKNNATIHLKKALSMAPNSPTAKDATTALQRLGQS
jgi:tetratricopeptide (TPR) repeat protein